VLLHLVGGPRNVRDAVATVHTVTPAAAIIVYSESGDARSQVEGTLPREWVHAYLQKPFAIEQVTRVLDALRHG
jgi:hypothetical protein